MRLTNNQYAEVMERAVAEGASAEMVVRRVVHKLRAMHQSRRLGAIVRALVRRETERSGVLPLQVTVPSRATANPIALAQEARERLGAREVRLTLTENASLIGGAIFQSSEARVDTSLRGKLNRLRQALGKR